MLLARESSTRGHLLRSVGSFTVGVVLFLLLIGLALAFGAGRWIAGVTFTSSAGRTLRLVVGFVLISFGWWQVRGKSLNMRWLNRLLQPLWRKQAELRRRQTMLGYGLYGFSYILAGFG